MHIFNVITIGFLMIAAPLIEVFEVPVTYGPSISVIKETRKFAKALTAKKAGTRHKTLILSLNN